MAVFRSTVCVNKEGKSLWKMDTDRSCWLSED